MSRNTDLVNQNVLKLLPKISPKMYVFWMKCLIISLVSLITVVLSMDERIRNFIGETRKNYALSVPAFQTFPGTHGILECASLCLRLSFCMYFNYQISVKRGICEVFKGLHFQNSTQLVDLLGERPGFAFVQAISKVRTSQ